jgi:L-lactate dehydrogenase (cytochrome)
VTRCLEIIRSELDLTMALCGITDVRGVDCRALTSGGHLRAPAIAAEPHTEHLAAVQAA